MTPSQMFLQTTVLLAITDRNTDIVRRATIAIWLDWPANGAKGGTVESVGLLTRALLMDNCLAYLASKGWTHSIDDNVLTLTDPREQRFMSSEGDSLCK